MTKAKDPKFYQYPLFPDDIDNFKSNFNKRNIDSPVNVRNVSKSVDISLSQADINDITFQHSILCQTCLPFRDQKKLTFWTQKQGQATLTVQAIPDDDQYFGLPFGAKARLIFFYLNTMALKNKSKVINVGNSLSDFIKRLGLSRNGQNINAVKEQLKRLKNCTIKLSFESEGIIGHSKSMIIQEVLLTKDPEDTLFYKGQSGNSIITLSDYYYNSLIKHAVPLDERAISALSNNALALDIYSWLAHRLHRVDPDKPQFITWKAIKDQFGFNIKRMDNFKKNFRPALSLATMHYKESKVEENYNKGFVLYYTPPPVPSSSSRALIG